MRCALLTFVTALVFLKVKETSAIPTRCYTCTSTVTNPTCGHSFRSRHFLTKECSIGKKYCLKLVETAGRTPFIYRKCSHFDCSEERRRRSGHVSYCSVCETSLCNRATSDFTWWSLFVMLPTICQWTIN